MTHTRTHRETIKGRATRALRIIRAAASASVGALRAVREQIETDRKLREMWTKGMRSEHATRDDDACECVGCAPLDQAIWLEGTTRPGSIWHSAKSGQRVWVVVLEVEEADLAEQLRPLGLRPAQWCERPGEVWLSTTDRHLVAQAGPVRVRVGEGPRTQWSRVHAWETR